MLRLFGKQPFYLCMIAKCNSLHYALLTPTVAPLLVTTTFYIIFLFYQLVLYATQRNQIFRHLTTGTTIM